MLVGCFGFNGHLRQYFSLYRAVSRRERERGERTDESKCVQTTPTCTYCKRNRPLPYCYQRGWSGGAMVLGKRPALGHPTIWITVGQGPTALVVGAGGGCLDIFTLIYPFLSSFSLSLGDGPI